MRPVRLRYIVAATSAFAGTAGLGTVTAKQLNQTASDTTTATSWSFAQILTALARLTNATITILSIRQTLRGVGTDEYLIERSKVHLRCALRLRRMCCRNGGCYVKVGQHIGSLDHLFPTEYVQVMRQLQSRAPMAPFEDVLKVLKDDLGEEKTAQLRELSEKPCGAASLAQVHLAKLPSGETIAVKVQHKNVLKFSQVDMKTMEFLVNVAERIFPEFRFRWLVESTKKHLPLELDFLHEADNCEKAQKTYSHLGFVKFPKIYREFSTHRVLTMEYCNGGQVDDLEYINANGIRIKSVISMLGKLYAEMIFARGLVHCDPHPGNIFVRRSQANNGVELVLLDHGLYQELTPTFRHNYCELWLALMKGDMASIKQAAVTLNCGSSAELFACMVAGRSWDAIKSGGVAKVTRSTAEEAEIADWASRLIPQLTNILDVVPRELLLVLKTNDLIRSIQAKLKCQADRTAFLQLSRACVKTIADCKIRVAIHNASWPTFCWIYVTTRLTLFVQLAALYASEAAMTFGIFSTN